MRKSCFLLKFLLIADILCPTLGLKQLFIVQMNNSDNQFIHSKNIYRTLTLDQALVGASCGLWSLPASPAPDGLPLQPLPFRYQPYCAHLFLEHPIFFSSLLLLSVFLTPGFTESPLPGSLPSLLGPGEALLWAPTALALPTSCQHLTALITTALQRSPGAYLFCWLHRVLAALCQIFGFGPRPL